MHNTNEAQTNELGRTKRSTAMEGLVGKGTMGALLVKDIDTQIEFSIGTGFTAEQRLAFWNRRATLVGSVAKYKHFPYLLLFLFRLILKECFLLLLLQKKYLHYHLEQIKTEV
jgi:hypothetical protein